MKLRPRPRRSKTEGFALAETLISVAFTGTALAGAFALAQTSGTVASQADVRQRFAALASDIFERIRSDRRNADSYALSLQYAAEDCKNAAVAAPAISADAMIRWCLQADDASPYAAGLVRTVTVADAGSGKRVVTVVLQGGTSARPAETVVKRVIEVPP